METQLKKLKCKACEGLEGNLSTAQIKKYLSTLNNWKIKNKTLHKEFKFSNFKESLLFANRIGFIAEQEGHHPDIEFGWGYAKISLFTHSLKCISINDFIVAAKIDNI
ncbi:4a-hydroxytetrahydrobiopterin dehydratase [Candidatus Pacearchaeota archaeon]|nr:4a-hydroxytetrahydrobiopterin dehydratase [Candidatus Pacearchaeota archaeon]